MQSVSRRTRNKSRACLFICFVIHFYFLHWLSCSGWGQEAEESWVGSRIHKVAKTGKNEKNFTSFRYISQ